MCLFTLGSREGCVRLVGEPGCSAGWGGDQGPSREPRCTAPFLKSSRAWRRQGAWFPRAQRPPSPRVRPRLTCVSPSLSVRSSDSEEAFETPESTTPVKAPPAPPPPPPEVVPEPEVSVPPSPEEPGNQGPAPQGDTGTPAGRTGVPGTPRSGDAGLGAVGVSGAEGSGPQALCLRGLLGAFHLLHLHPQSGRGGGWVLGGSGAVSGSALCV